jgi:chromosome partitioning protein
MTAILVGGIKGGTGKSTLACNLVVMFQSMGKDVLLVDCDRQRTADDFAQRRSLSGNLPPIPSVCLRGGQIHIALADMTARYSQMVIDCGGQDSMELRAAMVCPAVSLMLIPMRASYPDLSTLVELSARVREAKIYNPALRALVVLNCVPINASRIRAIEEAREFILSDLPDLEFSENSLCDRVAYRYSLAAGEGVSEYELRSKRENKATEEIRALFNEVNNG